MLGADADEVVFIQNSTTGINTVLRNLDFSDGDVILDFNTIYGACHKTVESIGEQRPVKPQQVILTHPAHEDEVVDAFMAAVDQTRQGGQTARLAMFDTVLTWPGLGFPWERLVRVCRELGILSLVDAAHGVGHIDMSIVASVQPDFLVSNCYK